MTSGPVAEVPVVATGRPAHIPALTGLRFVAAAVVLLEHFHQIVPGSSAETFKQGGAGVSLFFVLSGFVLTHNYGERFARRPADRVELGRYAVARVARLVPLHLLTLAVVVVLVFWRADPIGEYGVTTTAASLVANITLLHGWIPAVSFDIWNGPSWSISVELFFYLAFPLLIPMVVVPIVRRAWTGRAIVMTIVGQLAVFVAVSAVAAQILLSRSHDAEGARLIVGRLAQVPALRIGEFVVGCLLGAAFRPERRAVATGGLAWLQRRGFRTAAITGCVVAFVAIQFTPVCPSTSCWPESENALALVDLRLFAVYVPVVVVLVAAVAWGDSAYARPLSHPVMIRLGEASYAIYLVQWIGWIVINDPAVGPPGAALAWAAIVGSIAVALVVHRWFEQPARRWVVDRFSPPRRN